MKRSKRHSHEEEAGELNLVPYMDIVVNLILFLMLSSTGLVAFGVLNVSAPAIGAGDGAPPEEPKDPPLNLTIGVTPRGFYIQGSGGGLPAPGSTNDPAILKQGDKYDYAALTKKLVEVKSVFRNETKVIITGDSSVPYETIVSVMDASRQDGTNILFPDVMLSPGVAN